MIYIGGDATKCTRPPGFHIGVMSAGRLIYTFIPNKCRGTKSVDTAGFWKYIVHKSDKQQEKQLIYMQENLSMSLKSQHSSNCCKNAANSR